MFYKSEKLHYGGYKQSPVTPEVLSLPILAGASRKKLEKSGIYRNPFHHPPGVYNLPHSEDRCLYFGRYRDFIYIVQQEM